MIPTSTNKEYSGRAVSTHRHIEGLLTEEVISLQKQYGKNIFQFKKEYRFLHIVWDIIHEPMFILLAIACSLYFILGEISEGIMMALAMVIIMAISVYQEAKSSKAIRALKQFTEPKTPVIRNNSEQLINSQDLVPGDIMLLEEGMKIPADALIMQQNDLSIDESVITGESLPVAKNEGEGQNKLFQGSTINSGKCTAMVTAIGNDTTLGQIGKSISGYSLPKTVLQLEVNKFVRRLALFGFASFLIIFAVNYLHYQEFTVSLLFALTLAMSVVPEEIPVAFSSFMALGAYKMSRSGIISRQPQIIENLGAMTVLCLDKTGTITENKMELKSIYEFEKDRLIEFSVDGKPENSEVLFYSVLASESKPFDSMEKAIWEAYDISAGKDPHEDLAMIHEYPLEGQPPMMTHVYKKGEIIIAAAKGSGERILDVCKLDNIIRRKVFDHIKTLAEKGYRILGVASCIHSSGHFPANQDDFAWKFEGLLALYDPPKKNVPGVIKKIYEAGVDIKLITGDYPETGISIAQQVGIHNSGRFATGSKVMAMPADELRLKVRTTNIFVRMFPEAKLKVINAIKANGDIVAMTGDGVNDGPALKSADIGIAMGKRGTETARQASDLVLTDDNLDKISIAVQEGRKIYSNLVKAIRYIISIHVPIILTASLPLILGWTYPNIFTPIHVIFMELIMGPTCSIFFEKEPIEEGSVLPGPRSRTMGLFSREELLISVVQGLMITAGILALYYVYMKNGHSIGETRTMVFTTLVLSNVFLTFTSRSFTRSIYHTIRYRNPLVPLLLIVSVIFLVLLHFAPFVQQLFKLDPVSSSDFWISLTVAFVSVMWFEVYKLNLSR
jgi:P-type Ca2+ transporter type 2C